jgi:BASS family bile acid:Na+ symporter
LLLRLLEASARQGPLLLAGGIFAGLLIPPLAAAFRDAITPTVLGLMTLVLLRVDFGRVLGFLKRPATVLAVLFVLLVVSPVLAFAAAAALGLPGGLGAALVLMATGCAATSSPAFARLVGLDGDVSFVVAILSTLLVPFTAPPLALGLLGLDLALSVSGLMGRLALVVGLPLCLSLLLRRVLGRERLERGGRAVDGAVVWLVVLYGFGVMDGMLARLLTDPVWVLAGLALAFGAAAALNVTTAGLMWWAGRRVALAAGLLSGNRNMALYLAVLPATTDPDVLLFFALCQFPLFLSPFLLKPVYARIRPA